jgi:HSP90 family molecular chaperone
MTREEVVGLIGTLAKSGTAELRQKLREAKNAAASEELIGQFGIGFYSTFMVADKVELLTRKAGESEATRWASSGEGTYTIESVDDAPQGTSVKLHLKPEDPEDELHDYTRSRRSGRSSSSIRTSSPGPSGWRSSDGPRRPRTVARTSSPLKPRPSTR